MTALITGASSGIGEALARRLASRCGCLVLVSEDEANLRRVAGGLSSEGAAEVPIRVLDLCRRDAAEELFAWCGEKGLAVDILANSAGVYANAEDEMKDPASLTYGPSKSYIRRFSESLHMNWKEYNVKITCLLPAGVDTSFFRLVNRPLFFHTVRRFYETLRARQKR